MTDKQHGAPFSGDIAHFAEAFFLEGGIAHSQDFIHQQDLWFEVGGNGERQAHVHAAGVALDWGVEEFFDFGKGDDLIQFADDFGFVHAQDGAVEEDVFAPGEFGVKAGADFEQAGNAPFDFDLSTGGGGDAREDFEQGAFAGAVAPNDAENFALFDGEGDVAQRPDGFGAGGGVLCADFEQGVGFAARARPPDFEVVGERAGADLSETVGFGEVFDGDDGGHGGKDGRLEIRTQRDGAARCN